MNIEKYNRIVDNYDDRNEKDNKALQKRNQNC